MMIFPESGFDGDAQSFMVKEAEAFFQDAFLGELHSPDIFDPKNDFLKFFLKNR
jgi:hypothetical protein